MTELRTVSTKASGDHKSRTELAVATADGTRYLDRGGELSGRDITAIAAGSSDLWALVDGAELHHREADGVWQLIARIEDGVGRTVGCHATDVFVGGADARLWRLDRARLQRVDSFDRAPTHEEWHTPWGGAPDVYTLASDGSDLYVGVHVGGILRSTDAREWTPTLDLHDDVHDVTLGDDGTVWAATGRRGLAGSVDRGETWTYSRDGAHATYALAVAVGSAGPLVSVSSGPFARDGQVYRLVDHRLVTVEGLPAFDGAVGPGRLVASGRRAAVALPDGSIFVSADGGVTWSSGAIGFGDVRGLAYTTPN